MSKSDKAKARNKRKQARQQAAQKRKPPVDSAMCKVCGRDKTPEPADPLFAAVNRMAMTQANGPERGDRFAYMYAKSTVLVTQTNQDKLCVCDIHNWNAAGVEYDQRGAAECWASLGVTEHVMREAEAQSLVSRAKGKGLSDEEQQRLKELQAYFAQHELRGGDGIFAHRPKSPPRDPNRKRAQLVVSSDDDPLYPFEEYLDAKYKGQDPNEIINALVAAEELGVEKAADAIGKSKDWIEGWAKLYGAEQVLRDLDFTEPFRRALLELTKLHPEDFRDLWEAEEAAQPEMEATPIGRQNLILSGIPFVRGRVETAELTRAREESRGIRPVRAFRPSWMTRGGRNR